ncbi:MAG: hypothetical protein ABSD80_12805 [Caulobacteraceae bacterium]|jgi:hypothetical protein
MPPTREPVPESGLQITSSGDGPFFLATWAGAGCAAGAATGVEAWAEDGAEAGSVGAGDEAGSAAAKTELTAARANADAKPATMNFDKRYLFKKWASQAPIAPLIIDEPRLLAKLGCLTNRLISNPGKAFGSSAVALADVSIDSSSYQIVR